MMSIDPEILHDALLLESAMNDAQEFGLVDALAEEIRRGNPRLLKNQNALDFIADTLTKSQKGRKRKKLTKKRNLQMIYEISMLAAAGIPIYSDSGCTLSDACELTADKFSLKRGTVVEIWQDRAKYYKEELSIMILGFHRLVAIRALHLLQDNLLLREIKNKRGEHFFWALSGILPAKEYSKIIVTAANDIIQTTGYKKLRTLNISISDRTSVYMFFRFSL
jgi:hypothetical protein